MDDEDENDVNRVRMVSNKTEEQSRESVLQSRSQSSLEEETTEIVGEHDVEFTIKIAIAVPTGQDEHSQLKDVTNKQMIDAPIAQNYYHLEYQLLPEEEHLKTDLVTYGVACKIYVDKHEARVVKTWQSDDVTWISWAFSKVVPVSRQMLLKIFNHTVELRLWNTKEMCSSRARFDRPKAFRLPQPKPGERPEDIGGVKTMVTEILHNYTSMQPKKGALGRPLVSERTKSVLQGIGQTSSDSKFHVTLSSKGRRPQQLAETGNLEDRSSPKGKKGAPIKGKNEKTKTGQREEKEVKKQLSEQSRSQAENIRKLGICMIPLKLSLLFAGNNIVTSRLENQVPGVEDMFLEISVNSPLMSDIQKEDLNPIVVHIYSATSMPASPISYADLKLKCQPAYCKYKFLGQSDHVTAGSGHSKNIYWNDTHVILLGTLESALLREYLNGPGMEIEVHDRDRKPELVTMKPTLFGDDIEDEKISHVGTVESRRTLYNPFHKRDQSWDPYGVAKVDLSDLLLGVRVLEVQVPILNCQVPDILGRTPSAAGRLVGVAGAVDGPVDQPLSAGHYIQENSMLKVKIQLAHPLTTPTPLLCKDYLAPSVECPFTRIILIFDYDNVELLRNIQTLVMSFNSRALGLDTMTQHAIDTALAMYKLSIVQQCSLDLDIVTGFHVLDGEKHIFVLEGLADKAIDVFWESLPRPRSSGVKVLYNSDLCFSKRLYGSLDVDLCRVKLHEPLSVMVQQPLLYVRDMVFKPCYDALMKLHQITLMDRIRNVAKYDLFPTAEMIVSMSREFGVPLTQKDLEELKHSVSKESVEQKVPQPEPSICEVGQPCSPVDFHNQASEEGLRTDKELKNFIDMNIRDVFLKSMAQHKEREQNMAAYLSLDIEPAYNYSTQYLNSTELVKEQLRQYLKNLDPNARYAYNQEFMSGMFSPVNVEQEMKNFEEESRRLWRTEKGWTNANRKSVRESYAPRNQLDPARLDELQETWVENNLHANILTSPLDRGHYPWNDRKKDLDLYSRPPPNFGSQVPLSLFVGDVHSTEELYADKLKSIEDWKSSVVTDSVRQYFHRLLPATEMTMEGFYSSNQLDRLKGLLKDPPRKYGLQLSSDVNDIPALSVIDQCLDKCANKAQQPLASCEWDSSGTFCGLRPGDGSHSWTRNDNQVPCYNYEHDRFKQLKGHDFSACHKSRNKLSLRPILPLRPEERDNNLFRRPFSASPYKQPLPPVTQQVQTNHALTTSAQIPEEVNSENVQVSENTTANAPPEYTSDVNLQMTALTKENHLLVTA